jgi:hypothetical protein
MLAPSVEIKQVATFLNFNLDLNILYVVRHKRMTLSDRSCGLRVI